MPLLLDLAVVLLVLLAALRGWRTGGITPLLRLAGLIAGLLGGLWLARLLSSSLSPVGHVALGAVCVIGGLVVGGAVGRRLAAAVVTTRPGLVDRVLGVAVRGGVTLFVLGLLATFAVAYGPRSWADAVRASALGPDSPAAVPVAGEVWAGVSRLVGATAPADLAALAPATTLTGPSTEDVDRVDAAVADSVLEVSTSRCGAGVVGTGFVAAASGGAALVVTNAHVVASASSVRVGGRDATVVVFDRRTDLAVLRVSGLDADPLPIAADDAANGSALVIVGYPEGGPRTAIGASVIQRMPVPNPGFADGGSLHQAYRLRAAVRHGNSGSPMLDLSGRVVGVVNALAETPGTAPGSTGYAISVDELHSVLTRALSAGDAAVATGSCTAPS